jgi:glycosyltransferase involved in cell wall biosynthesis
VIAIVSTTQGRGHGAEVLLGELLGAWRARSPPITVVAPERSAGAAYAAAAGFGWVRLGAPRDALPANVLAGHAAAAQLRGVRLIHAWSARALEVSWWMRRRLGVPATATVHDHPDATAQTPLRRWLWRRAANLHAAVAFPGAALEQAWRAAGFRRVSRVIANGTSDRALPGRKPGRAEIVIGFTGMYAPWKGFQIAAAWAGDAWPDHVRWAFFGETSPALAGAAAQLAARLGSRGRFEGEQPRERIFGAIDILVHCSTAFDPFPTVLIEAAAAGVPAVASSLGGAGEIVAHNETGFLFDPAAPDSGLAFVRQLATDGALRARLGGAARVRYERLFRVERMAEEYAEFWKALISAGR